MSDILDVKDFTQVTSLADNDRLLITVEANNQYAGSMKVSDFKNAFLKPLIEATTPTNAMKCSILTEDEYLAIATTDPKTLYVITATNATTGALEIASAFIGDLKFATGGNSTPSGVPIEILTLSDSDITIERGATKLITASWQPTNATDTTLSWLSANTLVATVDNGTINGLGKGTTVITVKARSGAKGTINVTVVVSLASLEIQGSGKIVSGYDEELTLVPTPSDADLNITGLSSTNSDITVEKSTADATKLIAKTSATTGKTTIKAVNVNGKQATIDLTVVPYIVYVTSSSIDKTDNSVTSIFTNWTISRKGSVSSYKYTESYMKDGVKTALQSVDYTAIPDNNIIQIELYAEFGNKIIDWTFKDAAGNEESITCNIVYKEPQLIHYSFDINVACTQEQAAAMTCAIPFFKFDKKFAYNLRNDDTRPSLWRSGFRFVNRENDAKSIPYVTPYTQADLNNMLASQLWRAPRRLGYTDGAGILKVFVFDTAGMVTEGLGTTESPTQILWDRKADEVGDRVDLVDTLKAKDYGGHFLIHNMTILATDAQYYTPKFDHDYTYALQRDRQTIYDKLKYTSLHFANPDGDWWYTRPVIKDPKTLLMSGGGNCYNVDPNNVYGKPDFRSVFEWNSDLSNVPLSEIRNTLLVDYVFNNNNPYTGNLYLGQWQAANNGLPTFAVELTHHIGSCDQYAESWNGNRKFFNEMFDKVGANGNDYIWFASGDEVVEYMYYQRVVKIVKTLTETGCRFNISFDIPDYLSYKTYSAKLGNCPATAQISMSTNETLTYLSKNVNTGLVNWGVSPDISERANRYLAAYLASKTNDNLDKAWYFIKQMGEMGTALATQLPEFNEKPVLDSLVYSATPTNSDLSLTTINSNKEFGEANFLDVSTDEAFSNPTVYQIASTDHKYYDSTDATCKNNLFTIKIGADFGVTQNLYARLRNIYGNSNSKLITTVLTRQTGVNDPAIDYVAPSKFLSDTEVTFTVNHSFISQMRYKLTDTFTDWMTVTDSITIPMAKGSYNLVVQGKNNLDEIVEKTYTINFTGKQQIIVFGNLSSAGNVANVGYVNRVGRSYTSSDAINDIAGNAFCTEQGQYSGYFSSQLAILYTKWGLTSIVAMNPAYWAIPSLTTENGNYPNSLIVNGDNKEVTLYGDVQTNTTYQACKLLTGVPQGTYKVRVLISQSKAGEASAANPCIVRVNNTTQKITDTTIFCNNNTIWQVFDNVKVDADGYMLISQYTDVMFPASYYSLPPIVLIEITKL